MLASTRQEQKRLVRTRRAAFVHAVTVLTAGSLSMLGATRTVAQDPAATLHGTVFGWSERTWLLLLDRDAIAGGRLSDEGMLGRFHPDIDDEFELDRISAAFAPTDEFAWQRQANGVRYATGSINQRRMHSALEARARVGLGRGWSARFRFDKEDGPSITRNLPRVGLEKRWPVGVSGLFEGTLTPDKPSMDITVGGEYRSSTGHARVTATLLDAFSDLIYQGLEVHPAFADTALDYSAPPLALRVAFDQQVGRHIRAEFDGGWMPRSTLRAYDQTAPDSGFGQSERFGMAGGLVEWTTLAAVRAGLTATWVHTEFERDALPQGRSEDSFDLDEQTVQVGSYLLAEPIAPFRLEAWVLREVRQYRKQFRDPSLNSSDYEDRSWKGQVIVRGQAPLGLRGLVALEFDLRDIVRGQGTIPGLQPQNRHGSRLKLEVGWRLMDRMWLEGGYRIDLDGDEHTHGDWFDGAHGRGALFW